MILWKMKLSVCIYTNRKYRHIEASNCPLAVELLFFSFKFQIADRATALVKKIDIHGITGALFISLQKGSKIIRERVSAGKPLGCTPATLVYKEL